MDTTATKKAERGCESQLSPEQLEASIAEIAQAGAERSRQRQQAEQVEFTLSSEVVHSNVEIAAINHEEK